ncbi:LOW QUALITY PROTEIN: hypothetical protein V1478_007641 [Vespula squamosa]|uniref:Uncharacterized protein n=1 Tax=Vespula squamosa TaxID=30214 RepID=A0ABD2B3P8_VESSQ
MPYGQRFITSVQRTKSFDRVIAVKDRNGGDRAGVAGTLQYCQYETPLQDDVSKTIGTIYLKSIEYAAVIWTNLFGD